MRDLRVTLVQSMLHWEDAAANRRMFGDMLAGSKGTTDLVVLPEMFNTGFSMRSKELAETMDGATVQWMRGISTKLGAAVYGSAIINEDGRYFNRGLFATPDGALISYDKRHLFRMAGEHQHFSAGAQRVVAGYLGWRILLQVCYDLRFPVFSRNRNDHDLALYVANWPEARRSAWNALLPARAIENLTYVVGVNRVGMDGKGIHYTGDSVIIGPKGDLMAGCTPAQEQVVTSKLDAQELIRFRDKFPAHMDADDFDLKF